MGRRLDFEAEGRRSRVARSGGHAIGADATLSGGSISSAVGRPGRRIHQKPSGVSYQPDVEFAHPKKETKQAFHAVKPKQPSMKRGVEDGVAKQLVEAPSAMSNAGANG